MTTPPGPPPAAECRRILDRALAGSALQAADLALLAAAPPAALDEALRSFAAEHGASALPVLAALGPETSERGLRRAVKRALYRLAQRGVRPPAPAPRAIVERQPERATRAWLSGIDGSGSRAAWIVFERADGGFTLCSLILNDAVGVLEVAGGEISKKRLERELATLRASQKLPWVETEASRAMGLVAEALALHRALGTSPPADFARWLLLFEAAVPAAPPPLPAEPDARLVERAAELFELPELAGWFLDPESVQSDALERLQARESRLVVSDQIKAEHEDAIVTRVVEREIAPDARARWVRRLAEMAVILRATERREHGEIAAAAAANLADATIPVHRDPFARGLARRGLEFAGEVALGRLSAAEVSRKPAPTGVVPEATPVPPAPGR